MHGTNRPVWETDAGLELPQLEGDVAADVCVVGLGGSGLAAVGALLERGTRVVGIDAAGVAAGAAGRNGGFLLGGLAMFHHDAVLRLGRSTASALYQQTLMQLDRMIEETPAAIRRTGTLRIAASAAEAEDCGRQLAAMGADGLPVEAYDGPEGHGLFFPRDAAFDPSARCRALATAALEGGARLFERSPAVSIAGGLVTTPKGAVRAPTVIVAVDGRLDAVLPELSARVRTARLQMLATAPVDITLARPVYSRWGLDYWQQLPDRRIVLGGCRDVGGDGEWTSSDVPTEAVQAALTRLLRERLATEAAVTHRWAASVAYTTNGLPILEQPRRNVWALGAYSGTGNVLGALAGRAVAELVTGGKSVVAALLRA